MEISGLFAHGPPPTPRFLLYIKGFIILLSVVTFALAIYTLNFESQSESYSPGVPAYLVFLAIFTWIIYGAPIAIQVFAPQLYFRVITLIASILSVIFWLVGWAWSTSWMTHAEDHAANNNTSYWTRSANLMGALAGVGVFTWILIVFELGYFCFCCVRYFGSGYVRNAKFIRNQKQGADQN
ncbi:hypothetical protein GGR53DRAFT_118289 [Hypoxylon sp. FL1150]|nr:hypothetical protein GGR53DRAFT_118289 [Hypoxylon sp. FL1150]